MVARQRCLCCIHSTPGTPLVLFRRTVFARNISTHVPSTYVSFSPFPRTALEAMQPQLIVCPLRRRFVLTMVSRPHSQRQRHAVLFPRFSAGPITVSFPYFWPVNSSFFVECLIAATSLPHLPSYQKVYFLPKYPLVYYIGRITQNMVVFKKFFEKYSDRKNYKKVYFSPKYPLFLYRIKCPFPHKKRKHLHASPSVQKKAPAAAKPFGTKGLVPALPGPCFFPLSKFTGTIFTFRRMAGCDVLGSVAASVCTRLSAKITPENIHNL